MDYAIDRFPNLTERLGKARTDRIRFHQKCTGRRQPAARNIVNPVYRAVQDIELNRGHPIDDILYGFAATTDDTKPLNVSRLFTILQVMEVVNTREIQLMTALSQRQAQKYFKVIRAALPFIARALKESNNG